MFVGDGMDQNVRETVEKKAITFYDSVSAPVLLLAPVFPRECPIWLRLYQCIETIFSVSIFVKEIPANKV